MSDQTNPLKITYGDFTLDFATLPQTSVVAMLRRGTSHFFGSEQASKVVAAFKLNEDGTTKCGLEDTEENRAKVLAECQAKALDAIQAGTVGISMRGPTVDPIAVIVNRLARKEVHDILKASGVKPPKKAEDTVEIGGTKYTTDQLIARRLDPTSPAGVDKKTGVPHADRLNKEASKIAAEQAKKNAKALEAAKAEGVEAL